jgi:hypothetical protein
LFLIRKRSRHEFSEISRPSRQIIRSSMTEKTHAKSASASSLDSKQGRRVHGTLGKRLRIGLAHHRVHAQAPMFVRL